MRFIYNRGTIIFIICAIVSLVPTLLASAMVAYAHTFADASDHPAITLGSIILFITPVLIYIMGDCLFYFKVVKQQAIPIQEKAQLVIGFMMAFITLYCLYFFSLDMISALLRTISRFT